MNTNPILTKNIFLVVILITLISSCSMQNNTHSGKVTYHYITDTHAQIKNQLQVANRLADTTLYFEQYPKYDTMTWVSEFQNNKTKTYIVRSEEEQHNDSINRANGQYVFDPIIYKLDSLNHWIETVRDTLYNIQEVLGQTTLIPYEEFVENDRAVEETFFGLKARQATLHFDMEYPNIGTPDFEIWYADGIQASAGPLEFFTKNKVILRAQNKGGIFLKVEAVDFEEMTFEEGHFSIPTESIQISMEDFHHVIGYH